MGDWCSANVALVISNDKESNDYDSFNFRGKVYELSSCSYLSLKKGDSLTLSDDGKTIDMSFSFYDGGGDIFEAVANQVEELSVMYETYKHQLADYIVNMHKEVGIYQFAESSDNDRFSNHKGSDADALIKSHDDFIDSQRSKLLEESDSNLRSHGFLKLMEYSVSLLKQISKPS